MLTLNRIQKEKKIVERMIRLFCYKKEGNTELCPRCNELLSYALGRLEHCPFGIRKTSCRKCPVHCYKSDMRQRMKEVMRYTGPRMLWYYPIDALRHIWREFKI